MCRVTATIATHAAATHRSGEVVTGYVVDADTEAPIASAVVHAAGDERSHPVGEHGEFTVALGELPAVVAGAQGYRMCWHPIRDSAEPAVLRLSRETPECVPHPAYPRPDFDRRPGSDGKWLSLNGTWSLRFDTEGVGLRDGWAVGTGYQHLVRVPFSYTSLAGVGEQARACNTCYASQFAARRGVVWYQREFTVPAGFAVGRHTLLRFGAVEWHSTVFLDGAQVARHDGGYSPFDVDLGELVPGASHSLVVRTVVPDNSEQTPYPQGKQTSWYTDTGGVWQSVWLEQADQARLDRVHVTPKIFFDGTKVRAAHAHVKVSANQSDALLRLRVRAQAGAPGAVAPSRMDGFGEPREPSFGEVVAETTVRLDGGRAEVTIPVLEPRLWEPDTPWLYRLEAELDGGEAGFDAVHTLFGLRTIGREWAPGHSPQEQLEVTRQYQYLMLNNRPIYLRSVLDQAFNPWGGYSYTGLYQGADLVSGTIDSPAKGSMLYDLALTKQLGFNSARLHIKVNDPLYYHWADVLGVLVWYDLPNFGYRGYSPTAEHLFESVLTDAVHRDYNHPSVVIWDVINEAWGVGGGIAEMRMSAKSKPWIERMVQLSRRLVGETRLVVDNSPCCNNYHCSADTDLLDFHGYYSTWEEWARVIDDYVHNTFPGSTHNMEADVFQSGQPLLNSEYGPWSGGAEMDQEVATPFRYTTELFRSRSKMAGYLFTELTDIEWEWNGWAAYDRTLEVPGYLDAAGRHRGVAVANADDVLLVCGRPVQRVLPGGALSVPVLASLFSGAPLDGLTLRWRVTGTDSVGVVLPEQPWQERRVAPERFTASELGMIRLEIPAALMTGRAVLELVRGDRLVATAQTALVSPPGMVAPLTAAGATVLPLDPLAADADWPMGSAMFGSGGARVAIGYGDGTFGWRLEVPKSLRDSEYDTVQLVLEVSAQRPDLPRTRHPQTSERRYPSTLRATVDGVGTHWLPLPDAPADARGVLSHDSGFDPGRYGYRVVLDFDAAAVRAAAREGSLSVTLGGTAGGLAVFGSRTGRYGITPQLVFSTGGVPGPEFGEPESYPESVEGAGVNSYLVPGSPAPGNASIMIVNVVNNLPYPVHGVFAELLVPGGWQATPDGDAAPELRPGEATALRYTVTPDHPGPAMLRTRVFFDGERGDQVTQREWVVPV